MPDRMLLATCCNCGRQLAACPDCVNTMRIDPHTGLPPDVKIIDGRPVPNPMPDPDAVERSRAEPLCDGCIERRNEAVGPTARILTSAERHRRNHAA